MSERSAIFFPLRSNAHALVAGRPAASVVSRLKLAALLHDRVLIEIGGFDIQAGPMGSFCFSRPPSNDLSARWQTPRERSISSSQPFQISFKASDAPPEEPMHGVLHSDTTVSWRPTFEPLIRDLAGTYDWLEFGTIRNTRPAEELAKPWVDADEKDPSLKDVIPEQFVRNTLIKNANVDLASGVTLGAAVSFDSFHARLVSARVRRGEAKPVFGPKALSLLVPEVSLMPWEEIDAARKLSGMADYRSLLRDIEAAALASAASIDDFERRVQTEYANHLREAAAKLAGLRLIRMRTAALDWVVGLPLNFIPWVGGVASSVPSLAHAEVQAFRGGPRWLAADEALRRRARPGSK